MRVKPAPNKRRARRLFVDASCCDEFASDAPGCIALVVTPLFVELVRRLAAVVVREASLGVLSVAVFSNHAEWLRDRRSSRPPATRIECAEMVVCKDHIQFQGLLGDSDLVVKSVTIDISTLEARLASQQA
jgi:hypothetical protein